MEKKFIFYIIAIIVILVAVFFSQQAYSGAIGQNLISAATHQAMAYLAKGSNFAMPSIYSKVSEQVQSGGEAIQNQINQTAQKISDTEKNIENYFSGIANSVLHPGENNNCPAQINQTTSPVN